jgi:diphthamide biosynthesis protein 4
MNEEGYYTHPCRCSGLYKITFHELEEGVDVVGCEGCGEWVGVGYEVIEDGEEDDGGEEGGE